MPQIVLSGREMKMSECIDFSRDLRLWWKLEILRKFSSIVQKKFNNISIILKKFATINMVHPIITKGHCRIATP